MAPPDDSPSTASSLSILLLTLTALSGEFPATQISRLPSTDGYRKKVLKSLKGENLLRTYYRDNLRGLRLTTHGKRWLINNWPAQFGPLLTGDNMINAPKYTIPFRLRLHRMAEVLVTMHNAGLATFPWEKPAVFQPTPPDDLFISRPAYFNSKEVKEIGPQGAKIRGSRATGVLLMDGGLFVVYNTAASQMKWEYKAEMRLKALLQIELCQRRLAEQLMDAPQSAIVFGSDMEQMPVLMGAGGDGRYNHFVLDGNFEHFYYLTNDRHGEVLLSLLCDAVERSYLDGLLSEDLGPLLPGWLVENDAMDGEAPVLFAYTCDMPRIRRFDTSLSLHGMSGTLICFDYQEDAMRRVCGPAITIEAIDFEIYERSAFHHTEKTD